MNPNIAISLPTFSEFLQAARMLVAPGVSLVALVVFVDGWYYRRQG